jgi:hypothetical protein
VAGKGEEDYQLLLSACFPLTNFFLSACCR